MKKIILTTILAVCSLGAIVHAQSVTYLLDYEGIPGSSTIQGYEDKIEVISYNHSVGRAISPPTGRSREASAPTVGELNIFMALDPKANMELTKAAFIGEGKTVKLKAVRANVDGPLREFMEIELTDTMISSMTQEGSNGNQVYLNLTLNFTKITFTTTPIDPRTGQPGAPQRFTYDLATGKGS